MTKNYIVKLNKLFPNIASGRKKFDYYEKRIQKNITLSKNYIKKIKKQSK